jgi:large subunit ribosomal protein L32
MRHNRSQRGRTRSHHALSEVSLTKCPDCNVAVKRHQACSNCGKYRGRVVIDVTKKVAKKKTEDKK